MRRFFAMLLAVLTVASLLCAMPIMAEGTDPRTSKFDGTQSDEAMNGLIITEILVNSKSGTMRDDTPTGESAAVFSSPDAMDYIEVYNAGDEPVNMFNYVILSAPYRDFTGESKDSGSNTATTPYKFTYMNTIKTGDIHSTANGAKADVKTYNNACSNYNDINYGVVNPGEIAVIWYWSAATDTACSDLGYSIGAMREGDERTFPYFRDYYGMDSETKIFVTNAKVSNTQVDQFQTLEYNYVYALADKSYKFEDAAITVQKVAGGGETRTLSNKIACMASYTTYNGVGIVTTQNMDEMSAYYVPSACAPDLVNENAKKVAELEDKLADYKACADYVEADCAFSYRETAIISFTEEPSPGGMPSWQWQYIEAGANLNHNPDPDPGEDVSFGYGLPYIDQMAWARAEAKVAEMVDPDNNGKKLPGITGAKDELTGNKDMAVEAQAAKTKELYNKLMDCYISDWLNANGDAENTLIVGADGRLITTKTDETYDWIAKADEYMNQKYLITLSNGNVGFVETKKDYDGYLTWLYEYYNPTCRGYGIIPQIRINGTTLEWEISYNRGVSWSGLGVKAVGTGIKTPVLRINGDTWFWEISYDGGITWASLEKKPSDVISPKLRINGYVWEISYDNGQTWVSLDVMAIANIIPQVCVDATTKEWNISYDGGKTWSTLGVKAVGGNLTTPVMTVNSDGYWAVSYDGEATWTALDIEGEDVLSPKLRIGAENYWEISCDEGTTWESLEVKAKENIAPQLCINSVSGMWEISYDRGTTWTSLGVKAVGDNVLKPLLRVNEDTECWEVSYDNGETWTLIEASPDVVTPKLRINKATGMWELSDDNGVTWRSLNVQANGTVTPKLRINTSTNMWEVSYDAGETWTSLGVKATGTAGTNGNTPQLRVNGITGMWEVSYDNGVSWQSTNTKAQGPQGTAGVAPRVRINVNTGMWEVTYNNGATWTSLGVSALGEDGVSPELRVNVNTNMWEISYDGGRTWTSLGVVAVGKDGEDGEDGKNGTDGKDGRDGRDGEKGATGADGKDGKDGANGVAIAAIGVGGASAAGVIGLVVSSLLKRRKLI